MGGGRKKMVNVVWVNLLPKKKGWRRKSIICKVPLMIEDKKYVKFACNI